MCFAQGGSTGGTDIVAMIINRYRTISYGKILIFSDFIIIGSSLLVGFNIDTVIYGYVMTAVVGYTVDMIMAGNQQSSQVLIVTHDYEKMADAIVQNIHRGVTLLDSQGWYTKERSKVVMVVCRKRETATILKFVKTIDPNAFMSVGSVLGVWQGDSRPSANPDAPLCRHSSSAGAAPPTRSALPEGVTVAGGEAVAVQFGRRRIYTGIVWRVHDRRPDFRTVKSVSRVLYGGMRLLAGADGPVGVDRLVLHVLPGGR